MAKQRRPRRAGKKKKNARTAVAETALRRRALRTVRRLLTQAEVTVRSIDGALRKALKTKRQAKARRERKARRG